MNDHSNLLHEDHSYSQTDRSDNLYNPIQTFSDENQVTYYVMCNYLKHTLIRYVFEIKPEK